MERNANDTFGNTGSGGTAGGATNSGFGSGTGNTSNTGTSDASFSRDTGTDAGGLADRARGAASTAQEKLADVGSQVRDGAGNLKNTIANALESGAERLRQQGAGGGQFAGAAATGGSTEMVGEQNRLAQTTNQLAGGMQGAADWLRDADLDGMKTSLEQQVKNHPGRTLAIAVGVGYLLGKAFRR
jgi:ElaB/YqjD/DUF883 family membrane-anchored ribosome-binding protein